MKKVMGDLIAMGKEGKLDIITQGCNCFCLMAAGLAKAIAREFPDAETVDKNTKVGDIDKLGTLTWAAWPREDESELKIVNLYTQFQPGRAFEYAAFRESLAALTEQIQDLAPQKIGFPLIGCGIGGGEREFMETILEAWSKTIAPHEVYLIELP